MLTSCNLREGTSAVELRSALETFAERLKSSDLVHSVGPVGKRQRDTILDTDEARDHEYFFTMSFRDREQRDRAIRNIAEDGGANVSLHVALQQLVSDPIFSCWEDLESESGPAVDGQ